MITFISRIAALLTALRWLEGGGVFDLAIVDMHMPEMDGVALARQIRQRNSTLPLVLFSSLGRREVGDDEKLLAAYLTKPIRQSQLYDTLIGLLAHDAAPKVVPAVSAASHLPDTAVRHPLRILLAEDNVVNQKLALRILQQMGYRADLASNGVEAVESVQRQVYELRGALAANDADRFRRAAHSLKSNSNTFAALALGAMATKLEVEGIGSVHEAAGEPLAALALEYARVAQALAELKRA